MIDVTIFLEGGKGKCFSLPYEDCAVPRIGEFIEYRFVPSPEERAEFAVDSALSLDQLHGKRFQVIEVEHVVSRRSWNKVCVQTYVYVIEIKKGKKHD